MIVFVALGSAPLYVRDALTQARRANPDDDIVLLYEDRDVAGADWRALATRQRVHLYDLAALRGDARLREFYARPSTRDRFRSQFWRHTSGRFFALRALMEREGVDVVTHFENDVLVYARLAALTQWPPFQEPRLAVVFENGSRAIPGIVHVGARSQLDMFTDFILRRGESEEGDDMTRFAQFREAEPLAVADLPTLPPATAGAVTTESLFSIETPEITLPPGDWLFDGARFGQYLGGIDPRNLQNPVRRWFRWQHGRLARPNGFVNESCRDDPSRYGYGVMTPDGASAAPAILSGGRAYPLACLHVHSKKLRRFTSDALDREWASVRGASS